MKVSIIVGGKFHAFNLADQLNKKNNLECIITSYPKFLTKKYNIKNKKIKSIIFKEIFLRFINKFFFIKNLFDSDLFLCNYFSKKASKLVNYQSSDIILGWSSFSKESFLIAKNYNCIKILERGSSHIKFQEEILKKEYKKLKIKPRLPSKQIIKKEIEEYNLADYISVPSEFVKNTFIKYGIDKNKIIKIPYGVDLKEFNFLKNNKDNKDFKIISVGSISVRKGSHYLIKAFKELNLQDSQLIFVGPIEPDFKIILKNFGNLERIKFVEKQKQNNLKHFYNKADIFVQCSIEEGLAMVQAQAMACGLPVICTENTGGAEIVDDGINGFIIPIRNTKILKDRILKLYNNPDKLKNMSSNAHQKAKYELSWKNYGDKVLKKYKKLIKNKS